MQVAALNSTEPRSVAVDGRDIRAIGERHSGCWAVTRLDSRPDELLYHPSHRLLRLGAVNAGCCRWAIRFSDRSRPQLALAR